MMQNDATATIKDRIQFLERKSTLEYQILHAEIKRGMDYIKPMHLLQNTFSEVINTPGIKHKAVNSIIGIVTGILAEKVVVGSTFNPFKKVYGLILEAVVARTVAKNFDSIKDTGESWYKRLFNRN